MTGSASRTPLHDVAIVGAYNTRQAKEIGVPELDVLLDAMHGAVASANMTLADVDGLNVTSSVRRTNAREVAAWLGGAPTWTGHDVGIPGIVEAALAIAAGLCDTVLMATAQAREHTDRAKTAPWTRPSNEFVECWGLHTPAEFALMARRHMHLYGTTREAMAEAAATIRNNGARNPEAVHHGRFVTRDDVLESRLVADPFRLLDCAMTSEGGAGLVLTRADRAADLGVRPVRLLGAGLDRQGMAYTGPPVWDRFGAVGTRAGLKAFAQAGIGPGDVDVAEFYDPFSFEIIRQLEIFGFCGEGEGGDFVLDGHVGLDGSLPIVTDGGLLSYSHAGLAQLIQRPINAVRQLRGELPDELTVGGAEVAITTNGGSGALFTDVLLLGTEAP